MKKQELTIQQRRTETLYEREIMRAVYWLSREERLPPIPISYCKIDSKFQTLKIYVIFSEKKEEEKQLLEFFSKKYSQVITRILASSKKFRRIPRLIFSIDKEFEKINRIEELLKSN